MQFRQQEWASPRLTHFYSSNSQVTFPSSNRNPSLSLKVTGYHSRTVLYFQLKHCARSILSYCSGHKSVTDKKNHLGLMHTYLVFTFQVISSQVSCFIIGTLKKKKKERILLWVKDSFQDLHWGGPHWLQTVIPQVFWLKNTSRQKWLLLCTSWITGQC